MPRMIACLLLLTGVLGAIGWYRADLAEMAGAGSWFAADRGNPAPVAPGFDGDRAMGYLRDVCAIGPRISGSQGMKKQQELMQKHFEALGAKVSFQRFQAKQHSKREPVEMANMVVSFLPDQKRRVILCSNYDTRPLAHEEPDRRDWSRPFISANDGGSGVACLMEIGNQLKDLKTQVGVDLVFFDGEEYVFDAHNDKYFFGSEHFAEIYKKDKPSYTYLGAVLLDMIAGKNPKFPIEPNSRFLAGSLQQQIWRIAEEQQCAAFRDHPSDKGPVQDDHLALNNIAKIPAIDVIDFDYPHWHRLSDVPDNCGPEGMAQVAKVLLVWVQRAK